MSDYQQRKNQQSKLGEGGVILAKLAKIGPKIRLFFYFFSSLVHQFFISLEIAQDDSLEDCPTSSRGKTHKKKFGGPKLYPKFGFLLFSQGCIFSFFDIAQDCSLGHCLISSRAETSKSCSPDCSRNDLFFSNVVKNSPKLACHYQKPLQHVFVD